MTNQMTGARYLAEALKQCGVSHVFFIDAVLRRALIEFEQLGIARVLTHSEKAAAYMADGYARVSGRVGVCMAQSVGAANLAAGLQDAYLHRAPVLALTGRKPPGWRSRNAYQEIVHGPLFEPVTKMRGEVETGDELPLMLEQAMRAATDGTPRPVHLDVNGLQGEVIEAATLTAPALPDARYGATPWHRPRPDAAAVETAAQRFNAARKPILICGAGAVTAGAHDEVRRLTEELLLPVATTTGGRGIIPTTHPLHVGVVGSYSAPFTNEIVHEADLVLYVGCHAGDQATHDWTVPAPGTAIVQIDVDGAEVGRNYPGVTPVVGDPSLALADLRAACGEETGSQDWAEAAGARVAASRAEQDAARRSDAAPLRVERLCHELSEALPENAILVADTGYSCIWTATMVELMHPGQTYLRAAGSLGWSFPASLGAKCAAPDRPVVCFSGDGAFYYHLPELETARRRNIPVVVVVNNNSAFGQGLPKVRAMYGDTPGDPDEIIRFGPTNFAEVARAFGVEGIRVEEPAALRPALERALALGTPVVVDVVTDAEPRAPEAWTPPS